MFRSRGERVVQKRRDDSWADEMKFADLDGSIMWLGTDPGKTCRWKADIRRPMFAHGSHLLTATPRIRLADRSHRCVIDLTGTRNAKFRSAAPH